MLFVLVGIVSGVLSSMGLGGGAVLVPLLSLLAVSQKGAQFANIFSFVIMASFVLIFNIKNKLVQIFPATVCAFFGVMSATACAFLVQNFDPSTLKTVFGLFLIATGIYEMLSVIKSAHQSN